MPRHRRATSAQARIAISLLLGCSVVDAATYRVGVGDGCTHDTLAGAIGDALNPSDTVLVTRSVTHSAVAVSIDTYRQLDIAGGYATCDQAEPDGSRTVLDGGGGAAAPVLRIVAQTGANVRLRGLEIIGGDPTGDSEGGGIAFRGDGVLELHDSMVRNNTAGYGGGIYAEGTGRAAELILGSGVFVQQNTATHSGGGVYVEGLEMTMVAPGSVLMFNTALGQGGGGYGGGLRVLGGPAGPGVAYIGSNGAGGLGAIYGNQALYGGGVALQGKADGEHRAELQLFSTDPARRTSIRGNSASVSGGAIHVRPEMDASLSGLVSGDARALLWNVDLDDNNAADGAAIFVDYASDGVVVENTYEGGELYFNAGGAPVANPGLPCAPGVPCGTIAGNVAHDGTAATEGAVLAVNEYAFAAVERVDWHGNHGGRLIHVEGSNHPLHGGARFRHLLLRDNVVTRQLIAAARFEGSTFLFDAITVAGNLVGAPQVLSLAGDVALTRSIVWQPARSTLAHSGGELEVASIIASEVDSLAAGPEAFVAEPRFIDPERGNYRLRAASPAVDAAPAGSNEPDIDSRQRPIDLWAVADLRGTRDIGAFERQSLQPLVLNADFDADLHLWPPVEGGATWTNEQNAVGVPGSGALVIDVENIAVPRMTAHMQCIHLPGPGIYRLNGWGRAGAGPAMLRDYVLLHWEFRSNGEEGCNVGAADTSGDHVLSRSNNWVRPSQPATIPVPASAWTSNSSIAIHLAVHDGGSVTSPPAVLGWFDGISLQLVPPGPAVFADGFEDP